MTTKHLIEASELYADLRYYERAKTLLDSREKGYVETIKILTHPVDNLWETITLPGGLLASLVGVLIKEKKDLLRTVYDIEVQ